MVVGIYHFLVLSVLLFSIGFFGLMARKNVLVILMSIELMLNAVNLLFVAFSQFYSLSSALVVAFFVMSISAAEAGVGLALLVVLYRLLKESQILKEIFKS